MVPMRDAREGSERREGPFRVTLGVSAGISIYKACDLVRRLRERSCEVRVVMTTHAAQMVAPVTFQALSGNAVITDFIFGMRIMACPYGNAAPCYQR